MPSRRRSDVRFVAAVLVVGALVATACSSSSNSGGRLDAAAQDVAVRRDGPRDSIRDDTARRELGADSRVVDAARDRGGATDGVIDATTFAIGETKLTLDAAGAPSLPLRVFYPAASAGVDVAPLAGAFPVLIFGHGYQQGVGDYRYLWQALVPRGTIVLLVERLTAAPAIDIDSYADDLVRVLAYLAGAGRQPGALLAQSLGSRVALGGHSTGGGASVLAAVRALQASKPAPDAVLLLAPLGTLGWPITGATEPHDAAAQLTRPLLVFDAAQDCLAKPATHAQPIYAAAPSTPGKDHLTALSGDHCGFSDCAGPGKAICELGETIGCAFVQPPTLPPCEQNALVQALVAPWLDHVLRGDASARGRFQTAAADPSLKLEHAP